MFGFGKKRESAERQAFREEFETTLAQIKDAPPEVRLAVSHALNMANSMLRQAFPDLASFKNAPRHEQSQYISKLTTVENSFYEKQDPATALGFGLLKMWLGAVQAHDSELEKTFEASLAWLSKQAEPNVLPDGNEEAETTREEGATRKIWNREDSIEIPTEQWANALALALRFGWNPAGPSTAFMADRVDVMPEVAAALHVAWSAAQNAALRSPQTFYPVRMDMASLALIVEFASQGRFKVHSV